MLIYIGADHRGFALKESLKAALQQEGYEVADVGAHGVVPDDDYPEYAKAVAQGVSSAPTETRGVLVCGSGVGMDVMANKFKDVRSVLAISTDQVYEARHDDDVNVFSVAADFTDPTLAEKMLKIFMTTPFGQDQKYARRLDEMRAGENK
jgi:ribose 5-phosphate isomerase B